MNLIPDWKRRWRKLWSIRLALLSATLSGAELAVPYLGGFLPPAMFSMLAVLTAVAAAIARVVAQPDVVVERRSTVRPAAADMASLDRATAQMGERRVRARRRADAVRLHRRAVS